MVSFEANVQQFILDEKLVEPGDRLLIACSGGMDSMALLHFFIKFQHNFKIQLFVTHVDHMLRGRISEEDRHFVESFCEKNNVPVFSTSIPIPNLIQKEGGNSQAICRRERYAFFSEIMEKNQINKLVTAHHADDQLESIIMALTKSGSINGIKGMYAKRNFANGTLIRPFLMVTKEEIKEYLVEMGGSYREDASNQKDDYTRNRFRHHIVPHLKKENNNVSAHAVVFAKNLQQDDDVLNTIAEERFPHIVSKNNNNSFVLKIPLFQNEAAALQRRIILILLNYIYNNSNNVHSWTLTSSLLNLCKNDEGSAVIHLPNGFIAKQQYHEVVFEKYETNSEALLEAEVPINKWTKLQGARLYIGEASNNLALENQSSSNLFYFNSQNFTPPLRIRARKDGDRISLKGMDAQKRLSRIFIDEKIPIHERDTWPVLVDAKEEILALIGIRVNKGLSKTKRLTDDLVMIIDKEC
ncbi:tRNA lysidine(34) synthetase TilS [Lysinibacillus sp. BW-2-10]|uniref:tRNA lysidine(34) synthetase TilS n=1 Tax=Lysinibacillus sp. BW-2-10 TaxID=2590030 RepID=UPI00117C0771|nr:tRNA lysidine(34) synthetase TilS [Lysinibacillus sp. BW-2-10]TSI05480.1 tRNA lysidine(34) synthetase TilS [Lysinibacillus sp. BW-2-10]